MTAAVSPEKHRLRPEYLLLGCVASVKLNVVGEIYVGELLAITVALLSIGHWRLSAGFRRLASLGVLWSFVQLISDVVNDTSLIDSIKGVGAPLFLVLASIGIFVWIRQRPRAWPSALLGASAGLLLNNVLYPSEYAQMNYWKWALGPSLALFFVTVITYFVRPRMRALYIVLFVATFVAISLANDSRTLPLFSLSAAVLYAGRESKTLSGVGRLFGRRWGAIKVALCVVPLGLLLNWGATSLMKSDIFLSFVGQEAAARISVQTMGEYGVLVGGRSEALASIEGFLERPLLGHGSWARDVSGYREQQAYRLYQLGYGDSVRTWFETDYLPFHSYLMGALVWGGVVGGAFWIYTLYWVVNCAIRHRRALGLLHLYVMVALTWNILFSPFGAAARWDTSIAIACIALLSLRNPRRIQTSHANLNSYHLVQSS